VTTPLRVLLVAMALSVSPVVCATGSEADFPASAVKTKKALPADFPALKLGYGALLNGSGRESDFTLLCYANGELLNRLDEYNSASISAEFGRRMEKETDIHVKLLLAAVAAMNGNVEAKSFIQGLAPDTDYNITISRLSTLGYLLHGDHPPEWVFDAIHDALRDTRSVTGMEKTLWAKETRFEVSYLADEFGSFTRDERYAKNPKSVPVLIEMAKRTDGRRGPIIGLGLTGDPQAIPVCLEFLEREDASIKEHKSKQFEPREELVFALADLRAKEAVPILLNYLHSSKVMKALGTIGDERAIDPLKNIVAKHGRVKNDPDDSKTRFQEREFAARMALIKLEKDDPYPKWFEVMQDKSLEWAQRREAVWELGHHPDARAIPFLLKAVKSDHDGAVVNQSITVLALYKYKAAVYGLIECFDANFDGKSDWKRARTPEMFAENIGEALRSLTGQNFGKNKAQWLKWWDEEGSHLDSLK